MTLVRVLGQHSRRWNLRSRLLFSIKYADADADDAIPCVSSSREGGGTLVKQVSWYGTWSGAKTTTTTKNRDSSLHHHEDVVPRSRISSTEVREGKNVKDKSTGKTGGWSYDAIVNAPNILSFARLLSGPAIAGLIIHGHVSTAVPLVLLSGATDWLDGYLARRQGLTHNILGSYLDPLADKVLVGSVVCSMGYAGIMSPYVWTLILGRDVCLIGGAFWARAHALNYTWPGLTRFFNISGTSSHAAPKAEPLFISKVNTVVQIALVSSCLVDSWIGWPGSSLITHVLEPATAVTTIWSLGAYIHAYRSGTIRLARS